MRPGAALSPGPRLRPAAGSTAANTSRSSSPRSGSPASSATKVARARGGGPRGGVPGSPGPWPHRAPPARPPRCGGPVRSGLPLRAPPLLPGLRALRATQVRGARPTGPGVVGVAYASGRAREIVPPPRWACRGAEPINRALVLWAGQARGRGPRAPPPLSAARRLAPLYASARALWLLVALAALGLFAHFLPAALLGRLRTLLPWT